MDLYQGEVPAACVWAVCTAYGDDSTPYIEWFITAATSSEVYREQAQWINSHHGGQVTRWLVPLPRQRMEADDVTAYVNVAVILEAPGARRLDIHKK
jgi:hypothetical protein